LNIFHSINDFRSSKKTILTLGTFDGVHIGHRKILERVAQNTENGKYESLVLTFFPHPRMVLQGESEVKLLNTLSEKIDLLKKIGVQNLVIHPFDKTFSRLTAEEFVVPNSLTINNSLGQIISRKEVSTASDLSLNTSSLSKGVYFITIAKDTQTKTLQFIKE